MKPTCLVIGGGLAGLFSASFLARLGYRVELVEAAPVIAPVLRGFQRQGWHFDTGFHYAGGFGRDGILTRIFHYLELADSLDPIPLRQKGYDRVRFLNGEEEFVFPCGTAPLIQACKERFPKESAGIDRYFNLLENVCDELPLLRLEPEALPGPAMEGCQHLSLRQVLTRCIDNFQLQRLLELHCLLHGVVADKIPFAHHAGIIGLFYRGVHSLSGGGERLTRVLAEGLSALQVRVHCGQKVQAVELDGNGRFSGLRFEDGTRLSGQTCIATLHPAALPALLPEGAFRPIYRRRLLSLQETGSASFLFGRPCGPLPDLTRSNVFLDFFGNPGALSGKQIYLTRGSGEARMGVVAICPDARKDWEGVEYAELKNQRLDQLRAGIAEHSPELAESIEWLDGGTPRTLQRFSRSPRGGIYGAAHSVDQTNPQPRTRVPGLFLAGQGVVAPGLLGTALSAFWACHLVDGSDRLRTGIMACS